MNVCGVNMYERVPVYLFVSVSMCLFTDVHDVSGGEKLFTYLSISSFTTDRTLRST